MNALSKDLRQRILYYALTHTVRETARIFRVSPNTVHLLKKLYYETGGIEPRVTQVVHAHAVSPEGEMYLQILLREDPDLTLDQLCDRYEQAYGIRVGVTTMHNTLKRLNLTYKKKTFHDPIKDSAQALDEKASYLSQLENVDPEDRLYLDETSSRLNENLAYGRSPAGERVDDTKPVSPGPAINTAAVLTCHGVEATWLYFGALTAKRFITYLEMYVLNLLVGTKVLIMDNHPVHCAKTVTEFLDKHDVRYIYIPTYSPELNPVEEALSKVKHYIRKCKPRTTEALFNSIQCAFTTISENDAIGYFNHSEEVLLVTI